jgi:hypothetical protein
MDIPLEAWVCPYCTRELLPGSGFRSWCTAEEKRQYEAEQVAGCLGAVVGIVVFCLSLSIFSVVPSLLLGAGAYLVTGIVAFLVLDGSAGR